MESERFDALTRSVASRRSLMAKAGGGGLGAIVLGALGLREEAAAATTCVLDARLFVRIGPSAGFPLLPKQTKSGQLTGQLHLTISSKGDLAGSTFVLADGTSFPVAGSVSSHLIGLRITLAKGQVLTLQGVDDGAVTACKGAIDGGLVGPHDGDIGDWHATVAPGGAPSATPTATDGSGSQGGAPTPIPANSSGTSGSSQPTDTPAPTTTTTTTTAAPTDTPTEVVCGECQTPLSRGIGNGNPCNPIADNTPCSVGLCCGGICGDLSNNPNHCGACGTVCPGGCCQNSTCCLNCGSGETDCNGACINLNADANNCGACGNVCPSGQICFSGGCATDHRGNGTGGCPQGQINCGGACLKLKVCP